jgi:hypothetical protein
MLLIGIFVISNFIACFSSTDYAHSILYMSVTFYLVLSFIFIMCLICEDPDRVTNVIWSAYVMSAALAAALAILGYFRLLPGSEIFTRAGGRAQGLFKDPNVLAPYLVPATIYCFSKFEMGRGRQAIFSLALVLLLAVGLLLAFSRGAAGNFALTFVAYLLLRLLTARDGAGVTRLVWCTALCLIVGGATLSWLLLHTDAGHLFEMRAHALQNYDKDRFEAQQEGMQIILSWPFGIGPGRAQQAISVALISHNLYIQMFLENGWLGGISFTVLLTVGIARSIGLVSRGMDEPIFLVVLASVFGLVLNSFVIDSSHWRFMWLLLGMLWGNLLVASPSQSRLTFNRTRPRRHEAA